MHAPQTWDRFDWDRAAATWQAWWAGQLERPLLWITHTEPDRSLPLAPLFVPQLPEDLSADQIVDRYEARLRRTHFHADAVPTWFVNYGAGILAAFLGAQVGVDANTVWFHPPSQVPLDRLDLRFDPANPWWRRVRDVTETAARRWAGKACVSFTDLGGNLDILASLRTTEGLLLDTLDAPDALERRVAEVTGIWLDCYDRLDRIIAPANAGRTPWAPIWSTERTYMLQCDFAYMISPAMFERFVLPDLAACCERMEHGFYHLDGKGQIPHLDLLCGLDRLRGIQWVPGDGQGDPAEWTDVLARIRSAGKLCQVFTSPEGALRIIDEHDRGRGFMLAVNSRRLTTDAAIEEFLAEVESRLDAKLD